MGKNTEKKKENEKGKGEYLKEYYLGREIIKNIDC